MKKARNTITLAVCCIILSFTNLFALHSGQPAFPKFSTFSYYSHYGIETAFPKNQNTIRLQKAFPYLPTFSTVSRTVTEVTYCDDKMLTVVREGYIYKFNNSWDVSHLDTVLDIKNHLGSIGGAAGLFGMAFSPNFKKDGFVYVYYVRGDNNYGYIMRYETDNYLFDTSSATIVMSDSSFYPGHYGGRIAFGPDNYLYIATGDAGNGTDTSGSHARRLTNIWGKLLRIDVSTSPYTIPVTNPFYDSANTLIRKEIFAYGFRNLWKFSFDSSGTIWGGDVGEHRKEEIDIIENGKDYGWNKMEGNLCYPDTAECDTAGLNLTAPILTYDHRGPNLFISGGIVGGYVSYSDLNPTLRGKYIYADINQATIWSYPHDILWDTTRDTQVHFWITFGQDIYNNLYISRRDANQTNTIFRIRDNTPDVNYDGFVDLTDVLLVYSEALNYRSGVSNCDINLDYVVDNTDVMMVYNEQ